MALIVLCNTDFFGVHDNGRRAKALNEAESIARRSGREGRDNLDENLVSRRTDDCGFD